MWRRKLARAWREAGRMPERVLQCRVQTTHSREERVNTRLAGSYKVVLQRRIWVWTAELGNETGPCGSQDREVTREEHWPSSVCHLLRSYGHGAHAAEELFQVLLPRQEEPREFTSYISSATGCGCSRRMEVPPHFQ